jgi:hypothetical protein
LDAPVLRIATRFAARTALRLGSEAVWKGSGKKYEYRRTVK